MILPIITAISRDVLRSVPRAQIEGTLALGATWWQSSWEMLLLFAVGIVRRGDAGPRAGGRRDDGDHDGDRQQQSDQRVDIFSGADDVELVGQ